MGLRNIINQPSEIATRGSNATQRNAHAHAHANAHVSHLTGMSRCSYDMPYTICDGTHDPSLRHALHVSLSVIT